jgi:hypothetical protein
VPDDYFVFTLVRNPWDRIVSYYHWLRARGFDHPAVKVAKSVDFAGFLRDPMIQNSIRQSPYTSYVSGADGTDRCHAYVRLEHQADFAPVWKHLGFELTIPHANPSKRDLNWRRYYDAEAFEIVAEIAASDILRFKYQSAL